MHFIAVGSWDVRKALQVKILELKVLYPHEVEFQVFRPLLLPDSPFMSTLSSNVDISAMISRQNLNLPISKSSRVVHAV